ncbi:predicted protein [Lichtheimia corymbifera JMRC:FSU:9682]|uniref:Uncharacterized protein n=1 Tax=Lichtheimia corymbifera JMRC:FSU:9682 TaxID=1263082 RepID=A0A068RMX6_9FUNG|nr:predicted protein [Lichtheimia corymbifera JMRC:FSU:9682]
MKRVVFHRTKVLAGANRILCASFTIEVANPKFRNVTTSQHGSTSCNQKYFWSVATLGESENGHDDRETSTQGALDPAAQLCSIEDPTFHCRIFSYGHLCVLHML